MNRFAVCCCILLLASLSRADVPLDVKGPGVAVVKVDRVVIVQEDATVIQSFPVTISAPAGSGIYFWSVPAGVSIEDRGNAAVIKAAPKGPLTVSVKSVLPDLDKDGKFLGFKTSLGSITVNVGEIAPTPPLPPEPPPTPPEPPGPPPIPTPDGTRALIIFEKTNGSPLLSKSQADEIRSAEFSEFMNRICVKENDWPAWRTYDKDVKGLENAPAWWGDMMRRPRTDDRWLIVTDGKNSYEGPLPPGGEIANKIRSVLKLK